MIHGMEELRGAHERAAAAIRAIPAEAFDWRIPDGWAPRQLAAHLTSANDFYLMILEEARAAAWGDVLPHGGMASWRRVRTTWDDVDRCAGVAAAAELFERSRVRLVAALAGLAAVELDRPFVFHDPQPDAGVEETTLRRRIFGPAVGHTLEHLAQLEEMLAGWRSAG